MCYLRREGNLKERGESKGERGILRREGNLDEEIFKEFQTI